MNTYNGGMTTRAVAADVDPLSLERQVCFALAITNRAGVAGWVAAPAGAARADPSPIPGDAGDLGQREIQLATAVGEADSGTAANGFGHVVADAQTAPGARLHHPVAQRHRRTHHAGGADHQGPHLTSQGPDDSARSGR